MCRRDGGRSHSSDGSHDLAMELDLKAAFEKKYARIMQREALQGRLGVRVCEYRPE